MEIRMGSLAVPLDRDGREVPATVETMYEDDGTARKVRYLLVDTNAVRDSADGRYEPTQKCWGVYLEGGGAHSARRLRELHLVRPDSWERLEYDAMMIPASYCDARGLAQNSFGQVSAMCLDIVRRARALAGVGGKGGEARGDE